MGTFSLITFAIYLWNWMTDFSQCILPNFGMLPRLHSFLPPGDRVQPPQICSTSMHWLTFALTFALGYHFFGGFPGWCWCWSWCSFRPCLRHCATHNKRIMLPLVECQKSLPLVCQLPLLLSSDCLLFVCLFVCLSPHSKKFQFNGEKLEKFSCQELLIYLNRSSVAHPAKVFKKKCSLKLIELEIV